MNKVATNGDVRDPAVYRARLGRLRTAMAAAGVDACIVPSADPHLSEYPPVHWRARAWLSGFTGSVATLVVTADFAGLWVDSRYWVQAEAELDGTSIVLMKLVGGQPQAHVDWLAANLHVGTVAIDGNVLALGAARALLAAFAKPVAAAQPNAAGGTDSGQIADCCVATDSTAIARQGVTVRTDLDLLDRIWEERPPLPKKMVFEHLPPYASEPRTARLAMVREEMTQASADHHLLSTLDDIAWIFNLRGSDVSYNPVFVAHALIGPERATLFADSDKFSDELLAQLGKEGIDVAEYELVRAAVRDLPDQTRLLVDPRRMTYGLVQAAQERVRGDREIHLIESHNPSTLAKARKSAADTAHVRATMEQDGGALCEFFAWLEARQAEKDETLSELSVDEALRAARARRPGFVCESFGTIAGFNANGAMPHYRATAASYSMIRGDGLLLIDSGGQYLGGTTDITRVVPIGTPSRAQKDDFTTVLKGTIALSCAKFPDGIRSPMLDAIARAPLWSEGLDFGHGTGHGVGYFLNVHEGPQVISHYANPEPVTAMAEGMITSIEPGVYRPGKWGIRIENLVISQPSPVGGESGEFGKFLEFETLTLCPIDTRCIVLERLTVQERQWLNAYHATVRARLSPHVEGDAKAWLWTRTEAI